LAPESFEIIISIDGSIDESLDTCKQWSTKFRNFKIVILNKNSGFSAAANAALEIAEGDYIIFTDDDCLPNPDWIEKMYLALQSSEIVAGGIDSLSDNYLVLAANISEFHPFMKMGVIKEVEFIAGANMGFHRTVLDNLDGFLVGHPIPDMELILRARKNEYRVFSHPECRVLHDPRRGRWQQMFEHTSNYSFHTIQLRNEYQDLMNTPIILKNRWLLVIFAPLIAAGKTMQIFVNNLNLFRFFYTLPIIFLHKLYWCKGAFLGLSKFFGY
jgi:glycosyltransferase involved in cell wall biosynthesis